MDNFKVVSHPLIKEKLRFLRDKKTPNIEFRKLLSEISYLMTFEITRDLKLKDVEIDSPMETMTAQVIDEHIAIVPILRAGLGMLNGILDLLPTSKVGIIGLYRDDETLEAKEYYCKLPKDIDNRLTSAGIEVDKIENEIPSFTNVIAAKVIEIEEHPKN